MCADPKEVRSFSRVSCCSFGLMDSSGIFGFGAPSKDLRLFELTKVDRCNIDHVIVIPKYNMYKLFFSCKTAFLKFPERRYINIRMHSVHNT